MSVIAIDFDETITDNTPYPLTGNIRLEVYDIIKKLHSEGHTLILWTARPEPYYSECIERLKVEGLYEYFSDISCCKVGETGKIVADIYVDDRSVRSLKELENILKEE